MIAFLRYKSNQIYYLACINGTCTCPLPYYLSANQCLPKRMFTDPCNSTFHCQDFNPFNLICRYGSTIPPVLQCLCNVTSYWEPCFQQCARSKRVKTSSAYFFSITSMFSSAMKLVQLIQIAQLLNVISQLICNASMIVIQMPIWLDGGMFWKSCVLNKKTAKWKFT